MIHFSTCMLAMLICTISALPLNINLGAYSPALVVGDGEISFGGNQDVSNLMNALEGAAVNGAASAAAAAPAATPAPATETQVTDQATQIAALQGMGKEIAPRIVTLEEHDVESRDLSGFDRALKYAADAIKTTPKIELGTEAAGVGILQNAGISADPAATTAVAARDESSLATKMKTTVTTMFVRGGPVPAGTNARSEGQEKRDPSPGLDGVNLNVADGQVAELTFVETRAVDDEDE